MSILDTYRGNQVLNLDFRNGYFQDKYRTANSPTAVGSVLFSGGRAGRSVTFANPDVESYLYYDWASSNLENTATFYAIINTRNYVDAVYEGILSCADASNTNWALFIDSGVLKLTIGSTTVSCVSNFQDGKDYIIVATIDTTTMSASPVRIWFGGNREVRSNMSLTGNLNKNTLTELYVGTYLDPPAYTSFNGRIYRAGILDIALSEEEVSDLISELSSDPIYRHSPTRHILDFDSRDLYETYISDGKGYNKTLVDVSSGMLSNTQFEVTYGTWAVSLDSNNTKRLRCVTSGQVSLPIYQTDGQWKFSFLKSSSSSITIAFISDVKDITLFSGYSLTVLSDEGINLNEITGGSLTGSLFTTVSNVVPSGSEYTIKITRDSSTNTFTVYLVDGEIETILPVSSGSNPVVNTTFSESKYFIISAGSGDEIFNIENKSENI